MKASSRPQMMRLFDGIQTVMILMALQNVMTANDRILVHDTFADNNMFDGTPAMWGEADCGGSCQGILTRFDVTDGRVNIGLNESFAMWRVLSVDGEALEAANDWSVRAHFRSDIDITSIFGVGTDSLYWAARPFHAGDQTTHLANGHGWDNNDSEDRLPSFDDWVVQLACILTIWTGSLGRLIRRKILFDWNGIVASISRPACLSSGATGAVEPALIK
ncbi:MAG: hypothetical protein R3C28_23615 [Pirellulaceae bacterium]